MNLKISLIVLLVFGAILAGLQIGISSSKNFMVEHIQPEAAKVYPDGRYTAPQPEQYIVHISNALAWQYANQNSKIWKWAAFIVVILMAVYLGLCAVGAAEYNHRIFFLGMILSIAGWVAAYSSALGSENKRILSPAEYEQAKGDLSSLFTRESLIR